MLQYYICMLASVTSTLISSYRGLVFRGSTAQRANGGFIVWAFGFTPRASPHLGVCNPEGSQAQLKENCSQSKPVFSKQVYIPLVSNGIWNLVSTLQSRFFLKKLEADEVIQKLIRFNSTQSPILISVLDQSVLIQPRAQFYTIIYQSKMLKHLKNTFFIYYAKCTHGQFLDTFFIYYAKCINDQFHIRIR